MRAPLLDGLQGLVAVARQPRTVALVLEDAGHEVADIGLVVDDQDVCSHNLKAPSVDIGGPSGPRLARLANGIRVATRAGR